jgi:hypothetical protein
MGLEGHSSCFLENSVLGMVNTFPLRGFRGIGFVTVPAFTGLEGRSVQVERHRSCLGWIPHLVVSNVVRDVGQATPTVLVLRDTVQLPVVPNLPYASLEDL